MVVKSEFRLYGFIRDNLGDVGWDTKHPQRGGAVYEQNEALHDSRLKEALGLGRPEAVVVLGSNRFWVIEAKVQNVDDAIEDAKKRADQINAVQGMACPIITGVAGDPETSHIVRTLCLVGNKWTPLRINCRESTGFISPQEVDAVLQRGNGDLENYDISDKRFSTKIREINGILHHGAFHKKNRASVVACILLALAQDQNMSVSGNTHTLIDDINARAKAKLAEFGKENFYEEMSINLPTSRDNHVKNRTALTRAIDILRGLNIVSAINSGRDVLGQCYEQFLKYANDAKEIGIVLTPRHITNFGSEVIDVQSNDRVFDPTCGTGGFLVAALDKVRRDIVRKGSGDIDQFKKGNLFGVEQDAGIATLAIVNMIFRGDGSSNIREGDCMSTSLNKAQPEYDKVLMNPPFAQNIPEGDFVTRALSQMKPDGLLFAILPTTVMSSGNDQRREISWRREMLERHTLVAAIKMPEDLFYPHVSKGTYGIVIKAHCPHDMRSDKVVWAVLRDGVVHSKTQKAGATRNNIEVIQKAVKHYASSSESVPRYRAAELDCTLIQCDGDNKGILDLSPEQHIGLGRKQGDFDINSTVLSEQSGWDLLRSPSAEPVRAASCGKFHLSEFFSESERGKSGRNKTLGIGALPLISTSEKNNGISALVDRSSVNKIYPAGTITVSANGASCRAFYHSYEVAVNGDVYACRLNDEYAGREFALFLCAAINAEAWRFNYFRKFSDGQFQNITIKIPVTQGKRIDFTAIIDMVSQCQKAKPVM